MKVIQYGVMGKTNVYNEATKTEDQQELVYTVTIPWNTANEKRAKEQSYNGVFTIEDDGQAELVTQADRIEAQVTYTAMMTDTLLEV